jgi:DNA polymerase III subunit epsilon
MIADGKCIGMRIDANIARSFTSSSRLRHPDRLFITPLHHTSSSHFFITPLHHLMRLAFVDLETTGGSPFEDRITEVGIIEVDLDETDLRQPPQPIREWSALVNPDAPIPPFIETLTGITNAMVADAPRFEELAEDILARLDGRLFIAHNARFDHGFLKNAFRRMGHAFRPPVLCTVRLSRKLYPGYSRHNLDTLIERHRLVVDMRHRALGDARLLWQLWQKFHDALPADQISAAIDQLTARPSLPRHLDPDVLDTLPKTAGVYLFHGEPTEEEKAQHVEESRPLYIGKAKNLRQRVMAHFTGDHLSAREMEISQQMTRIEVIETGGGTQKDLGALLTEATLVKQRMPAYNRQLRKSDDVCAWRLVIARGHVRSSKPRWKLALARPDDLFFAQDEDLYGPFASPRQAGVTLRAIADAHGLCPAVLKLEKAHPGKPCFAYQVKRCHGACIGLETLEEHTARLKDALASLAIVPWPFDGPIAFQEGHRFHVVDGWAYLGMAANLDEARRRAATQRLFDHDVYRLLVKRIAAMDVVRLR